MRYYKEVTVNGIIHDMYQGNHIPKATDYPSIEIPDSPWHTGEPTEDGWYLIAFHPWGRKENRICYMGLEWKDGHWFDHVNDCKTEPYLVAWQKIEPFKEATE